MHAVSLKRRSRRVRPPAPRRAEPLPPRRRWAQVAVAPAPLVPAAAAAAGPPPPQFLAILAHPFRGLKKNMHLLLTRAPFQTLALHNRGQTTNRETRETAPYLRLVRAVGPFYDRALALVFCSELARGAKRLSATCRLAEQLAVDFGVTCYTPDAPLPAATPTLAAYLAAAGAPAAYAATLDALAAAAAVFGPAAAALG